MGRLARLNGWRRLWVVVTVIAFFYTVGWGVVEGAKQYRVEYQVISGFGNPRCSAVIQMPARAKLHPEPHYEDPCWNLYLYRSIYNGAAQTVDGYIEHMNANQNRVILQTVGVGLVLWVVGVSMLYGIGKVFAWVVRGFRINQ